MEAERLQLALVRHTARPIALVRQQAGTTVGCNALDEEDLCFFARLEGTEVVVLVRFGVGDEPRRVHVELQCRDPVAGLPTGASGDRNDRVARAGSRCSNDRHGFTPPDSADGAEDGRSAASGQVIFGV